MTKVAVANVIVRCGFRNEKEVEGNGRGDGPLGTHRVTYLWLRKHVAAPWGQAVCCQRHSDKEPACLKPQWGRRCSLTQFLTLFKQPQLKTKRLALQK